MSSKIKIERPNWAICTWEVALSTNRQAFETQSCYRQPSSSDGLERDARFNTETYSVGDYFQIPGLKAIAQRHFCHAFKGVQTWHTFHEIVKQVYTSTSASDRGLRDIVTARVTENPGQSYPGRGYSPQMCRVLRLIFVFIYRILVLQCLDIVYRRINIVHVLYASITMYLLVDRIAWCPARYHAIHTICYSALYFNTVQSRLSRVNLATSRRHFRTETPKPELSTLGIGFDMRDEGMRGIKGIRYPWDRVCSRPSQ